MVQKLLCISALYLANVVELLSVLAVVFRSVSIFCCRVSAWAGALWGVVVAVHRDPMLLSSVLALTTCNRDPNLSRDPSCFPKPRMRRLSSGSSPFTELLFAATGLDVWNCLTATGCTT